jgi:hypothetical protein
MTFGKERPWPAQLVFNTLDKILLRPKKKTEIEDVNPLLEETRLLISAVFTNSNSLELAANGKGYKYPNRVEAKVGDYCKVTFYDDGLGLKAHIGWYATASGPDNNHVQPYEQECRAVMVQDMLQPLLDDLFLRAHTPTSNEYYNY